MSATECDEFPTKEVEFDVVKRLSQAKTFADVRWLSLVEAEPTPQVEAKKRICNAKSKDLRVLSISLVEM